MPTFVLIETLGTQEYIFRSNRLAENLGASELVRRATVDWVWEAVHGPRGGDWARTLDYDAQPAGGAAEIITTAGGNAFLVCRDAESARKLVWAITSRALREAPGVRLNAALETVEEGETVLLADVRAALNAGLTAGRARALATASLAGLSVTAPCVSTGQPATGWWRGEGGEADRRVSAEVVAKMCAGRDRRGTANAARCAGDGAPSATERLRASFRGLLDGLAERLGHRVDFSDQLDHLGRADGESSYLAVVHADGNGIGRFFQNARLTDGDDATPLAEQARRARSFSRMSDEAALAALREAMQAVADAITWGDGGPAIAAPAASAVPPLALARHSDRDGAFFVFPVRPIVFGGDDVTLVSDGRIGLALAAAYVEAFERAAGALSAEAGSAVTASAGVAIVKSHYPFAQAYALAEALTSHAKARGTRESGGAGALDWHVAQSAVYTDDIEAMRAREYDSAAGRATLRPVFVGADARASVRTWAAVEAGVRGFREGPWAGRRSKAKRLADVIREGPDATRAYLEAARRAEAARSGEASEAEAAVALPPLPLPEAAVAEARLPADAASREAEGEARRRASADADAARRAALTTGWLDGRSLYADAVSLLDLHLPLAAAAASTGVPASPVPA